MEKSIRCQDGIGVMTGKEGTRMGNVMGMKKMGEVGEAAIILLNFAKFTMIVNQQSVQKCPLRSAVSHLSTEIYVV
jgi:hypothetical protein